MTTNSESILQVIFSRGSKSRTIPPPPQAMSWRSHKLPQSESHKGLLSSPKTVLGTPSTVANQDRMGQSPEVEHYQSKMSSFAKGDANDAGRSTTRSRFSTLTGGKKRMQDKPLFDNWEDNLDRDEVLQPEYGRAEHISSLFQTNPMLNLYSDRAANATISARMPLDSPSAPPRLPGVAGQAQRGGLGEEDEIDLRPPPSVHDPYVAGEKARVERLRKKLEAERVSVDSTQAVEMNSSIAMQEQLAKIFDLQMQLADMHADMEGIHDSSTGKGDGSDVEEGSGLRRGSKTPILSPASKQMSSPGATKSPNTKTQKLESEEEGNHEKTTGNASSDEPVAKRDNQIDAIVNKLSDLSTLLHQFHSMPHPNLDSAFPPSPASATSFARQAMPNPPSRRSTTGPDPAQGAA